MSNKYSNFDEDRDKLMKEIRRLAKKFNIPSQILNVSKINLDNYIPLGEMIPIKLECHKYIQLEYLNFYGKDIRFTYCHN